MTGPRSLHPMRDAEIVRLRLSGKTLAEIAEQFDMTRERARQICVSGGAGNKRTYANPPEGYAPIATLYEMFGRDYYPAGVSSLYQGLRNSGVPTIRYSGIRVIAYHIEAARAFLQERFDDVLPDIPEGYATMAQLAELSGRPVTSVRGILIDADVPSVHVGMHRARAYAQDAALAELECHTRWQLREGGALYNTVVAEYERGDSPSVIAARHGLHAPSLAVRLRGLVREGKADGSNQTRWFAGRGSQDHADIVDSYRDGIPVRQIAEALDVPPHLVRRRLRRDIALRTNEPPEVPGHADAHALYRLCGHRHYSSSTTLYAALMHHQVSWKRGPDGEGSRQFNIAETESLVRRMQRRKRERAASAAERADA